MNGNEPIQPDGINAALPAEPEPAADAELAAAGFWVRAGSLVIDSVVLWIVQFSMAFSGIPGASLLGLVAHFAYHTASIAAWGQTFGKMAAGTKVIMLDGSRPSPGRAALRAAGMMLSGILVGLGYFVAAFTPQKRSLHDYIAGTRVVYTPGVGRGRQAAMVAVALFGLMLPVAIGVLFALGLARMPSMAGAGGAGGRLSGLKLKASEGEVKGHLGSLRAASSIYFGDKEGVYPPELNALTALGPGGKAWIEAIPTLETAEHGASAEVENYGAEICTGEGGINGAALRDTGRWGYVADQKSPCWGQVFVDCTHSDTQGRPWHQF